MSKTELVAHIKYDAPRVEDVVSVRPVKRTVGLAFKKEQKAVVEALEGLGDDAALALRAALAANGSAPLALAGGASVTINADMVEIVQARPRRGLRRFAGP